MALPLVGFGCGVLFGWGLLISDMVNPRKVLNFLDIFGSWDPSLGIVMGSALLVSGIGYAVAARRRPVAMIASASAWSWATIDRDLILGAALFGIGWGLVGLCPGPALANLASLTPAILVFVAAMAAGMGLHAILFSPRKTTRVLTADG